MTENQIDTCAHLFISYLFQSQFCTLTFLISPSTGSNDKDLFLKLYRTIYIHLPPPPFVFSFAVFSRCLAFEPSSVPILKPCSFTAPCRLTAGVICLRLQVLGSRSVCLAMSSGSYLDLRFVIHQ